VKQEVEPADACVFWLFLPKLKKSFQVGTLKFGAEITSKQTLAGLEKTEITVHAELSFFNLKLFLPLTALYLDIIYLHVCRH
jgi:hypothetical protein